MDFLKEGPESALEIFELLFAVNTAVELRSQRFLSQRDLTLPQYQLLLAAMSGEVDTLGGPG
ncbi:MAG TPA: hypothetical protein VGK74_15210 [Symbiobacteriaceae bacterium]